MPKPAHLLSLILITCSWTPQAHAAIGVSTKSVEDWSVDKLCESKAKYENRKDWKAVSIIVHELANRNGIDLEVCRQIGDEYMARLGERKREYSLRALSYENELELKRVITNTHQRHGKKIVSATLEQACGNESDLDIEEIQNYSISLISSDKATITPVVSNYWLYHTRGIYVALAGMARHNPALCDPSAADALTETILDFVIKTTN